MMNHTCQYNPQGNHSFYMFVILEPVEVKGPFIPYSFQTCIACGHRRAVDVAGNLWYFDADQALWFKKTDASDSNG